MSLFICKRIAASGARLGRLRGEGAGMVFCHYYGQCRCVENDEF